MNGTFTALCLYATVWICSFSSGTSKYGAECFIYITKNTFTVDEETAQ
jgi:hypothetical protein